MRLAAMHTCPAFEKLDQKSCSATLATSASGSTIEASLPPGIFVVGSAYRGVGVADTVRNANEVAERVRVHLAGDERSSEREHVR